MAARNTFPDPNELIYGWHRGQGERHEEVGSEVFAKADSVCRCLQATQYSYLVIYFNIGHKLTILSRESLVDIFNIKNQQNPVKNTD